MLGLLFMILNKLLYCDSNFIDLLLVSFLNNLCLSFLSYNEFAGSIPLTVLRTYEMVVCVAVQSFGGEAGGQ